MKYNRGFSNFHYSVRGGSLSPLRGAVKLSRKPVTVNRDVTVRLSDGSTAVYSEIYESGASAGLSVVCLPVSFLCDVLGFYRDESGVLYEGRQRPVHFSLFYETKTDSEPVRHQLFDVVCAKPSFDASTIADRPAVDPRELELIINPDIMNTGFYARQVCRADNAELFDSWFGMKG